jgi:hypothetical protein
LLLQWTPLNFVLRQGRSYTPKSRCEVAQTKEGKRWRSRNFPPKPWSKIPKLERNFGTILLRMDFKKQANEHPSDEVEIVPTKSRPSKPLIFLVI